MATPTQPLTAACADMNVKTKNLQNEQNNTKKKILAKEPNTNTDDCATAAQKPLQLALGVLSASVVCVCRCHRQRVASNNNNNTNTRVFTEALKLVAYIFYKPLHRIWHLAFQIWAIIFSQMLLVGGVAARVDTAAK